MGVPVGFAKDPTLKASAPIDIKLSFDTSLSVAYVRCEQLSKMTLILVDFVG